MADKAIIVDTSVLIDFFRKSDKSNSLLISLVKQGYVFHISAITEYEIYSGATAIQKDYWQELLDKTEVFPFDKNVVKVAVEINSLLKRKRKQIELADLFIAATAISLDLPFATLNRKHFERIDKLNIVGQPEQ
jgi:predicted nucleic acid-binding protein